jgi:protein O-mannosyl-transferase
MEPKMHFSIRQCGLALLMVFFAFSLYSQLLRSDFINYDDQGYVYDNPQVARGISLSGIRWAFASTEQSNWHPLSWISHMLDVSLYGLWPGGHHLTSLLLHLLNSLLVLWIFHRMTAEFWPSLLLASLFAIHPMHIESVAWISERKDVLSTFFFLLTILAYHSYSKRQQIRRMAVVTGLFALGLMAKPMLVTLPFVLLLFDYWPLGRFDSRITGCDISAPRGLHLQWLPPARLWLEKTPLFALSGIFCLITAMVQNESMAEMQAIAFSDRLMHALTGYGLYILKAVSPLHLMVIYPLTMPASVWPGLLSGLVVLAICALLLLKKCPRYLFVGWFFFLGTLIPVIGLVQVGNQAIADRYTYIPYVGLFIMAVYGVSAIQKQASYPLHLAIMIVAGLVLAGLSFLTSRHVPRWKNSQALFSYAVSVMPNNAEALFHLADDAMARKTYPDARALYREGLIYKPSDFKAFNNLGTAYLVTNNLNEALKCYEAALRINPKYELASRNRTFVEQFLARNPNNSAR